ncbi:MAG TPA: hypothetical protein VFK09_03410 [Gemmatimonadales bacterium]|nr:hypothetical protein [Gemmatimonadales bacterium]
MTSPLGPAAFFALEAGECLDRLDALAGAADGPDPEEFLRVARVLRGSALMANKAHLGRAAAGFEALGRALRAGTRAWDPATREQVAQAIDDYRGLVRRVNDWQDPDAARAAALASQLESLAGQRGGAPERARAVAGGAAEEVQTGVRAFVAREGALIASALDRAARAFRSDPADREPLYMVLRRMQSLQGLAELPELPPLPEILDGIELAVGDLARLHAPPPGVEVVLAAGALAMSRVARDIAERGLPGADAEEPRRFTELLVEAFAVERDVVPIETLFPAGEASPITRPPDVPHFSPPTPPGSLELVSLGEHLSQTAALLDQARTATELDLRLYRLIGTLRNASSPHGEPVCDALGVLARAAREAVASGAARERRAEFTAALRDAGELLRASGAAPDRMFLSRRILDAAHQVDLLRTTERPAAPPVEPEAAPQAGAPTAAMPEAAAAEPLQPPEEPASAGPVAEPVVPIEALGYDDATAGVAPSPLADAVAGYQRRVREQGLGAASLEGLTGAEAPSPETGVVEIGALCYRGRAALERAAVVRAEIADRLARTNDLAAVQPLIQELLDLVPLALTEPA